MAATTQIVFTPGNKEVTARVGDRMEDVAKAAGMDVQYKCKKGECGTCEVRVNGKWTKACQLTIPTIPKGEVMRVSVTPATARENAQLKTAAKFFSPQSFVEGFINNALGVVGFVSKALEVDKEFSQRMEREKQLQDKLAAKKKSKDGS